MARNNKSPKVSFTLTDLTTMLRNVVRGNGKTPKTGAGTFQYTTNNGEYVEMEGGTITPLPTTTTTTTEEPTTTTTTTIDYTVISYRIITSRNVQSFPGSTLPSSYNFELKDSNGDFVYSDYDVKCIVESIPNGGYGSWNIGVENNSDEYLSVGDNDLVRFSFAGTEVVGPFNQSTRGYYIDTETRFGNTIDKYIINIVDGEVISIVSFDSIGDVSDCNLPTTTTTTTTVAPTTTTTTTESLNFIPNTTQFKFNNSDIKDEFANNNNINIGLFNIFTEQTNGVLNTSLLQDLMDAAYDDYHNENYIQNPPLKIDSLGGTIAYYGQGISDPVIGDQLYDYNGNTISGAGARYVSRISSTLFSDMTQDFADKQINGGTFRFIGWDSSGIVRDIQDITIPSPTTTTTTTL